MAGDEDKPKLSDYLEDLGLPGDFSEVVPASDSDLVAQLWDEFEREASEQRFLLGVLMGFLCVAEDLLGQTGDLSLSDGLTAYPPLETGPGGKRLNTLTIEGPNSRVGLRKYYGNAERVIKARLRRYDFPNCAPHATQSWAQHRGIEPPRVLRRPV